MKHIIIILAALLLFSAIITNPTMDDFEHYAGSKIDAELQGLTGHGFFSRALGKAIRTGIRTVTDRHDYKLFSIYHVKLPIINFELKYLGMFGQFYLLNGQRNNDMPEEYSDEEDVMQL